MSYRYRPSTGSRPPTCRRPANGTFRLRFRNASLRISAFRSATPGRKFASRAASRWQASRDLETTFQYQLLKNDDHELAMLLGLIVDWGGTGADQFRYRNALQPTDADLLFRQGVRRPARQRRMAARLRALPDRSAIRSRPNPTISCKTRFIPQVLTYGASLQYSMPYLKSRDPGSAASRFHQSPDPDRRSTAVDAGRQ